VIRDRFAMSEYIDLQSDFLSRTKVDQHQLGELIERSEVIFTSSKGVHHPRLHAIPLHLHLDNSTSAHVGRTLLDLDVELRRTASYLSRGSVRPSRNNYIVEVLSAQHTASIDVVVAAAHEIYDLLTSRPLDFVQLMVWFWDHRHNRTKVLQPYEEIDPIQVWQNLYQSAADCVALDRSVTVTVDMTIEGATTFGFGSQ
jgi:hypothetical protein